MRALHTPHGDRTIGDRAEPPLSEERTHRDSPGFERSLVHGSRRKTTARSVQRSEHRVEACGTHPDKDVHDDDSIREAAAAASFGKRPRMEPFSLRFAELETCRLSFRRGVGARNAQAEGRACPFYEEERVVNEPQSLAMPFV